MCNCTRAFYTQHQNVFVRLCSCIRCICGLLKNKCRILVTHQLQHLRAADHIVLLQEVRQISDNRWFGLYRRLTLCVSQGQITAQGTYMELQRSGLDVVSLMRSDEEQDKYSQAADLDKQSLHSQKSNWSHSSHCSFSSLLPPDCSVTEEPPVCTVSLWIPACHKSMMIVTFPQYGGCVVKTHTHIELYSHWWISVFLQAETVLTMSEEARVEGNVSRHIYLKYFTAGCSILVLMVILLLSIVAEVSHHSQAVQTFTGCWILTSHRLCA